MANNNLDTVFSFTVKPEFDSAGLETLRSQLMTLREEAQSVFDVSNSTAGFMLSGEIEKLNISTEHLIRNIEKVQTLSHDKTSTKKDIESALSVVKNGWEDLVTRRNMIFESSGEFSKKFIESFIPKGGELKSAVQKELSTVIPALRQEITKALSSEVPGRNLTKGTRKNYEGFTEHFAIRSPIDIAKLALGQGFDKNGIDTNTGINIAAGENIRKTLSKVKTLSEPDKLRFLSAMVAQSMGAQQSNEYRAARGFDKTEKELLEFVSKKAQREGSTITKGVDDYLPKLFKGSYANAGYRGSNDGKLSSEMFLSPQGFGQLLKAMSNNSILTEAMVTSGLAKRNPDGGVLVSSKISQTDIANGLASALYGEFYRRTMGLKEKIGHGSEAYYYGRAKNQSNSAKLAVQNKIIDRMFAGTSGRTLSAMELVSDLIYGGEDVYGDQNMWSKKMGNVDSAKRVAMIGGFLGGKRAGFTGKDIVGSAMSGSTEYLDSSKIFRLMAKKNSGWAENGSKRMNNIYTTEKYSPFLDLIAKARGETLPESLSFSNVLNGRSETVTTNENQILRLLMRGVGGKEKPVAISNYGSVDGLVKEISLEGLEQAKNILGQDAVNAALLNINQRYGHSGPNVDPDWEIAASHGFSNAQTIRLINRKRKNAINEDFAKIAASQFGLTTEQAKELDLFGNLLSLNTAESAKENGKLNEARNKSFTDSYEIAQYKLLTDAEFSALSEAEKKMFRPSSRNKGMFTNAPRVAAVDFARMGLESTNGLGYMLSPWLQSAAQVRGALGIKGSLSPIEGETMSEWIMKLVGGNTANPLESVANADIQERLAGYGIKYKVDDRGVRFYMPGFNANTGSREKGKGNLEDYGYVDVTDASGLIDESMIKNAPFFKMTDARAKKLVAQRGLPYDSKNKPDMYSEATSEALSTLLEYSGLSIVADYANDKARTSNIGGQMAKFLTLSPEFMEYQGEMIKKRFRELETNEGKRRYVFTKASEDKLSREVNDPIHGDEVLSADLNGQISEKVNQYKQSFLESLARGEIQDLDFQTDDPTKLAPEDRKLWGRIGKIQNRRLTTSAMLAAALIGKDATGGQAYSIEELRSGKTTLSEDVNINDAIVSEATDFLNNYWQKRGLKESFTSEMVHDILTLKNGVLDFENEDYLVASGARSPNGFGQYVSRANFAKIMRPYFEAKGLIKHDTASGQGLFLSEEDKMTMSGADLDADEAKMIYSNLFTAKNTGGGINNIFAALKALSKTGVPMATAMEDFAKQYGDILSANGFTGTNGSSVVKSDLSYNIAQTIETYNRIMKEAISQGKDISTFGLDYTETDLSKMGTAVLADKWAASEKEHGYGIDIRIKDPVVDPKTNKIVSKRALEGGEADVYELSPYEEGSDAWNKLSEETKKKYIENRKAVFSLSNPLMDIIYQRRAGEGAIKMGLPSDAGARASMLDLSNPINSFFAMTAAGSNHLYDLATTWQKKPVDIENGKIIMSAMMLGDEFTKVMDWVKEASVAELVGYTAVQREPDAKGPDKYTAERITDPSGRNMYRTADGHETWGGRYGEGKFDFVIPYKDESGSNAYDKYNDTDEFIDSEIGGRRYLTDVALGNRDTGTNGRFYMTKSGHWYDLSNQNRLFSQNKTGFGGGFMKIDKSNLPSIFNSADLMGLVNIEKLKRDFGIDTTLADDLTELFAKQGLGDTVDAVVKDLGENSALETMMRNKRTLTAQYLGKTRTYMSDAERTMLLKQRAAAENEINAWADSRETFDSYGNRTGLIEIMETDPDTGKKVSKRVDKEQFLRSLKNGAGFNQMDLALGAYSIRNPDGSRKYLQTGSFASNIAERAMRGDLELGEQLVYDNYLRGIDNTRIDPALIATDYNIPANTRGDEYFSHVREADRRFRSHTIPQFGKIETSANPERQQEVLGLLAEKPAYIDPEIGKPEIVKKETTSDEDTAAIKNAEQAAADAEQAAAAARIEAAKATISAANVIKENAKQKEEKAQTLMDEEAPPAPPTPPTPPEDVYGTNAGFNESNSGNSVHPENSFGNTLMFLEDIKGINEQLEVARKQLNEEIYKDVNNANVEGAWAESQYRTLTELKRKLDTARIVADQKGEGSPEKRRYNEAAEEYKRFRNAYEEGTRQRVINVANSSEATLDKINGQDISDYEKLAKTRELAFNSLDKINQAKVAFEVERDRLDKDFTETTADDAIKARKEADAEMLKQIEQRIADITNKRDLALKNIDDMTIEMLNEKMNAYSNAFGEKSTTTKETKQLTGVDARVRDANSQIETNIKGIEELINKEADRSAREKGLVEGTKAYNDYMGVETERLRQTKKYKAALDFFKNQQGEDKSAEREARFRQEAFDALNEDVENVKYASMGSEDQIAKRIKARKEFDKQVSEKIDARSALVKEYEDFKAHRIDKASIKTDEEAETIKAQIANLEKYKEDYATLQSDAVKEYTSDSINNTYAAIFKSGMSSDEKVERARSKMQEKAIKDYEELRRTADEYEGGENNEEYKALIQKALKNISAALKEGASVVVEGVDGAISGTGEYAESLKKELELQTKKDVMTYRKKAYSMMGSDLSSDEYIAAKIAEDGLTAQFNIDEFKKSAGPEDQYTAEQKKTLEQLEKARDYVNGREYKKRLKEEYDAQVASEDRQMYRAARMASGKGLTFEEDIEYRQKEAEARARTALARLRRRNEKDRDDNYYKEEDALEKALEYSQSDAFKDDLRWQNEIAKQYRSRQTDQIIARNRTSMNYYNENRRIQMLGGGMLSQVLSRENQERHQIQSQIDQYNAQVEQSKLSLGQSSSKEAYLAAVKALERGESVDTALSEAKKAGNVFNEEQFKAAAESMSKMSAESSRLTEQLEKSSGLAGLLKAGFDGAATSLNNLITRFTNQLLRKGFAEAKKYIVEMDTAYANIQAISMKSDPQMESVKDYTTETAKKLHRSGKDVATVEATLYRQGLSDAEVRERTEDVIKFSTVTGANVEKATKQLTTAVKTGLVGSLKEAMDAMVALGDSAATTAAEIAAGMQKSAATAKVAGVSFSELTALLTMGTENTQLGGTTIGTMLSTTMSRIRRVTANNLSDSNGDVSSINDAQKALKAAGLSIFEDEVSKTFKSTTQIFRDVASVWQNLNDVQKASITNAFAGTRQTNVFSSYMEAISEDGGKKLDEYIKIAENSEGITNKKYDIVTDTISTKLQDITNAFDNLVAALDASDIIKDVLDSIAEFINKLSSLGGAGGLTALASTIFGGGTLLKLAVQGLTKVLTAFPVAGVVAGIAAIATPLIAGAIKDAKDKAEKADQIAAAEKNKALSNSLDYAVTRRDNTEKILNQVKQYSNKYENIEDIKDSKEYNQFSASINAIKTLFPDAAESIDEAVNSTDGSFQKLIETLTGLYNFADNTALAIAKQNVLDTDFKEIAPEDTAVFGLNSLIGKTYNGVTITKDMLTGQTTPHVEGLGYFNQYSDGGLDQYAAVMMGLSKASKNSEERNLYEQIAQQYADFVSGKESVEGSGFDTDAYIPETLKDFISRWLDAGSKGLLGSFTPVDTDTFGGPEQAEKVYDSFIEFFGSQLGLYSADYEQQYAAFAQNLIENVMGRENIAAGWNQFGGAGTSDRLMADMQKWIDEGNNVEGMTPAEFYAAYLKDRFGLTATSSARDFLTAATSLNTDKSGKKYYNEEFGLYTDYNNAEEIGIDYKANVINNAKRKQEAVVQSLVESGLTPKEASEAALDEEAYKEAQSTIDEINSKTEEEITGLGYKILDGLVYADDTTRKVLVGFKDQLGAYQESSTIQELGVEFAAYMSQFSSLDELDEAISSNSEKLGRYAAIYQNADFANIVKGIDKGTSSYTDLLDFVLNNAKVFQTYSARMETIAEAQKIKSNDQIAQRILDGGYTPEQLKDFSNLIGIYLTGKTTEQIANYAFGYMEQSRNTAYDFLGEKTSGSIGIINSIMNDLKLSTEQKQTLVNGRNIVDVAKELKEYEGIDPNSIGALVDIISLLNDLSEMGYIAVAQVDDNGVASYDRRNSEVDTISGITATDIAIESATQLTEQTNNIAGALSVLESIKNSTFNRDTLTNFEANAIERDSSLAAAVNAFVETGSTDVDALIQKYISERLSIGAGRYTTAYATSLESAKTAEERYSAGIGLQGANIERANMSKLMDKYNNGTIKESELATLAAYLGLDINTVRNNKNAATTAFNVKGQTLTTQMGDFETESLRQINALLPSTVASFDDINDAIEYIDKNMSDLPSEAKEIADAWKDVASSVENAETPADRVNKLFGGIKENVNDINNKKDFLNIASGFSSITKLQEALKDPAFEEVTNMLSDWSEFADIMEKAAKNGWDLNTAIRELKATMGMGGTAATREEVLSKEDAFLAAAGENGILQSQFQNYYMNNNEDIVSKEALESNEYLGMMFNAGSYEEYKRYYNLAKLKQQSNKISYAYGLDKGLSDLVGNVQGMYSLDPQQQAENRYALEDALGTRDYISTIMDAANNGQKLNGEQINALNNFFGMEYDKEFGRMQEVWPIINGYYTDLFSSIKEIDESMYEQIVSGASNVTSNLELGYTKQQEHENEIANNLQEAKDALFTGVLKFIEDNENATIEGVQNYIQGQMNSVNDLEKDGTIGTIAGQKYDTLDDLLDDLFNTTTTYNQYGAYNKYSSPSYDEEMKALYDSLVAGSFTGFLSKQQQQGLTMRWGSAVANYWNGERDSITAQDLNDMEKAYNTWTTLNGIGDDNVRNNVSSIINANNPTERVAAINNIADEWANLIYAQDNLNASNTDIQSEIVSLTGVSDWGDKDGIEEAIERRLQTIQETITYLDEETIASLREEQEKRLDVKNTRKMLQAQRGADWEYARQQEWNTFVEEWNNSTAEQREALKVGMLNNSKYSNLILDDNFWNTLFDKNISDTERTKQFNIGSTYGKRFGYIENAAEDEVINLFNQIVAGNYKAVQDALFNNSDLSNAFATVFGSSELLDTVTKENFEDTLGIVPGLIKSARSNYYQNKVKNSAADEKVKSNLSPFVNVDDATAMTEAVLELEKSYGVYLQMKKYAEGGSDYSESNIKSAEQYFGEQLGSTEMGEAITRFGSIFNDTFDYLAQIWGDTVDVEKIKEAGENYSEQYLNQANAEAERTYNNTIFNEKNIKRWIATGAKKEDLGTYGLTDNEEIRNIMYNPDMNDAEKYMAYLGLTDEVKRFGYSTNGYKGKADTLYGYLTSGAFADARNMLSGDDMKGIQEEFEKWYGNSLLEFLEIGSTPTTEQQKAQYEVAKRASSEAYYNNLINTYGIREESKSLINGMSNEYTREQSVRSLEEEYGKYLQAYSAYSKGEAATERERQIAKDYFGGEFGSTQMISSVQDFSDRFVETFYLIGKIFGDTVNIDEIYSEAEKVKDYYENETLKNAQVEGQDIVKFQSELLSFIDGGLVGLEDYSMLKQNNDVASIMSDPTTSYGQKLASLYGLTTQGENLGVSKGYATYAEAEELYKALIDLSNGERGAFDEIYQSDNYDAIAELYSEIYDGGNLLKVAQANFTGSEDLEKWIADAATSRDKFFLDRSNGYSKVKDFWASYIDASSYGAAENEKTDLIANTRADIMQGQERINEINRMLSEASAFAGINDYVAALNVLGIQPEDEAATEKMRSQYLEAVLGLNKEGSDITTFWTALAESINGNTELLSALGLDTVYAGENTASYMQSVASTQYGKLSDSSMEVYSNMTLGMMEANASTEELLAAIADSPAWQTAINNSEELKKAISEYTASTGNAKKATDDLRKAIKRDTSDIAKTYKNLNGTFEDLDNINYYLNKGKWSADDKQEAAALVGIDKKNAKNFSDSYIKGILEGFRDADVTEINDGLTTLLKDRAQLNEDFSVDIGDIHLTAGSITTVGIDELMSQASAMGDETLYAWLEEMKSKYAAAEIQVDVGSDGNFTASFGGQVFSGHAGSRRSGGGGGGKSASDKLLEKLKNRISVNEHRVKMIQKEENMYQERGELTNYGTMLGYEKKEQKTLAQEYRNANKQIEAQMKKVEKNSDDWIKLRDQHMAYEEAIRDTEQAIEDLNKKLKENQEAIRQTTIALQDATRNEIEARKQRDRNMLAGTVELENEIIDSLKNRYQTEWMLLKEDMQKKQEALEQEKNLLTERLNARKNAEDEAKKYEELEEMKKQLSIISMDSTRAKEAEELRKKISDMESEFAWKSAEEEIEARQSVIDDAIAAYDDEITSGDDDLEAFLENANNFAQDIVRLLGASSDELYAWLAANSEAFANSLPEAQQQMLDSWEDTYNQAHNIMLKYWEEIAGIIDTKANYIKYMKQSDEYVNLTAELAAAKAAGDADRIAAAQENMKSLVYSWGELYDAYYNAHKDDNATWTHEDAWLNNAGSSSSSSSSSSSKSSPAPTPAADKDAGKTEPAKEQEQKIETVLEEVAEAAQELVAAAKSVAASPTAQTATSASAKKLANYAYASGGLVNYTGLAWVDGTPQKPEYVLNNDQFKALLNPGSPDYLRSDIYSNGKNSIGNVSITINEAQISSEADIEELANRVGDAFVNQLSMNGFNTSRYSR